MVTTVTIGSRFLCGRVLDPPVRYRRNRTILARRSSAFEHPGRSIAACARVRKWHRSDQTSRCTKAVSFRRVYGLTWWGQRRCSFVAVRDAAIIARIARALIQWITRTYNGWTSSFDRSSAARIRQRSYYPHLSRSSLAVVWQATSRRTGPTSSKLRVWVQWTGAEVRCTNQREPSGRKRCLAP